MFNRYIFRISLKNKSLFCKIRIFFQKLLKIHKLLCVWLIPVILLPIPLTIATNVSIFKYLIEL